MLKSNWLLRTFSEMGHLLQRGFLSGNSPRNCSRGIGTGIRTWTRKLLAGNLVAWSASAGLLAIYQGIIVPVGIISNVLAGILVSRVVYLKESAMHASKKSHMGDRRFHGITVIA